MKLADLQKKIADVLGVSSSQKELSFDVFIEKISEILVEQLTLKVPRIGYFQLKADWVKNGNPPIVFSPLSEDFLRDTRNLYLTIDVSPRVKPAAEIDSAIFSIGVGKPLLPLSIDEMPDTETSYAMIKKSIEERVKEVLMESDQIPNFGIWDDYYNTPGNYDSDSAEGAKYQLSELTADLDFAEEFIPDKLPDNILEVLDFNFTNENRAALPENQNPIPETGVAPETKKPDEDYLIVGQEKFTLGDDEKEKLQSDGASEKPIPETISAEVPGIHVPDEPDYNEEPENKITISELMDDLVPAADEAGSEPGKIQEGDSDLLPTEEVLDKILKEEEKGKDEDNSGVPGENVIRSVSPAFEEFHKINSEVKSDIEKMQAENEDELIESNEEPGLNSEAPETETLPDGNESGTVPEIYESEIPDIQAAETTTSGEEIEQDLPKGPEREAADEDEIEEESLEEEGAGRIEWNWGDELREEFGVPAAEEVDAKYEMVDKDGSGERNEIELVDDYLDVEPAKKDLFSQLEKTLERELKLENKAELELTSPDKKLNFTSDRDTLKKVILEFSGPPSKYEFVEERPEVKEKRMAITLMNETAARSVKTPEVKTSSPAEEEIGEKNNSSRKIMYISGGVFVFILLIIASIFFLRERSGEKVDAAGASGKVENKSDAGITPDNNAVQSQQSQESGITAVQEDMSEFPRTATPPVPIKDATDRQILETIKKESAKIEASSKQNALKSATQKKIGPENPELYKNAVPETKIGNRIFSDGKNYFLQVSSWPNRTRAEEEVNRLRGDGFNAFIVEANLPQKGGLWFRVRIGPFKSENETNDFLKKNNL